MGRRRSKWRKTTQIMKKMMLEAKKTRMRESLRQCPVCGTPFSLMIEIKQDKTRDVKHAVVRCSACGFEVTFENLPPIADEYWVYSKVLDYARGETIPAETPPAETAEATEATTSESSEQLPIEIEEVEVESSEEGTATEATEGS